MSGGFLLAGTRDGGDSSIPKQNPSKYARTPAQQLHPIFVNVNVNNKRQSAIIDTGSAVTIISQQLLKNIYHKEFVYNQKSHRSANCTSINIIGEIKLEIAIQGYKTWIVADVATNLITNLLLGNDWITQNNVIIDSPQQCLVLTDEHHRIITTTSFIKPPQHQLPILLINEIVLPAYSEKCIEVKVTSPVPDISEALFEPAPDFYSKQILLPSALIKMENNESRLTIINANARQRKLPKNTKLGYLSCTPELNNYLILPVLSTSETHQSTQLESKTHERNPTQVDGSWTSQTKGKRKVQSTDFACPIEEQQEQKHQCYVCREQFLTKKRFTTTSTTKMLSTGYT